MTATDSPATPTPAIDQPAAFIASRIVFPSQEVRTGPFEPELRELIAERGWSRVAVIAGPGVSRSIGLDARLTGLGAAELTQWSSGATHAPVAAVEDLAEKIRAWRPDVIVSVGGGSVHDLTKGVAALLDRGGALLDHCLRFEPPEDLQPQPLPGPKVPIVTVPSTLSGSESNGSAGFTVGDTGRKRVISDPSLFPVAVLVDGRVLDTTPTDVFRGSVMNSLNHAVEGLASRRRNPASEALLAKAFAELAEATDPATGDDRVRASIASALAGVGLSGSWLGLAHAIGHVLGARHRVPHGWCHAVMAGHAVRFNAPVAAREHAATAALVGARPDSGGLADWLDDRATAWGLPRTLRELGVREADIPALADAAWRDHDSFFNPRRATKDEIEAVLHEAF